MKQFLFIIIFFFGATHSAFSASVYLEAKPEALSGEVFEVVVYIDTQSESINGADFVLDFSEDLVSFAGYKEEGSFMKLWVNSPKTEAGKVVFSGIIPGGVDGLYDAKKKSTQPIPLARILFLAKDQGVVNFSLTKSEIYKNDGLGTLLPHSLSRASVVIIAPSQAGEIFEEEDTEVPIFSNLFLIKSSIFSRTPEMLVFDATDNDSGISKYEAKIGNGHFTKVSSPLPVTQGLFSKKVTIRAFDNQGNYTDSSVIVSGSKELQVAGIIILILLAGIWFRKLLK